ncbi:MAG TPA: type II toxin-antitoxin system VapC family toxin, partial [Thermoanaerobaculia bacterium]|nr:type II toxin-antitoxin system VapC family toxin [Thermoanaerobaculia bacterium]
MILVDANVFMYAAGVEHPHKAPSGGFLLRVAQGEVDAAVDAEVLQEILHRYRVMGRWADGRRVYESARRIVPITLPITCELIDAARDLLESYEGLTVRDAIHAAVALHGGADAICSYDRDFDCVV